MTWPEPELLAGAVPDDSPLPDDELELLLLPELLFAVLLLLAVLFVAPLFAVLLFAAAWVVLLAVELAAAPGRPAAMTPPAARLASPTVAVSTRSRVLPRSLAVISLSCADPALAGAGLVLAGAAAGRASCCRLLIAIGLP